MSKLTITINKGSANRLIANLNANAASEGVQNVADFAFEMAQESAPVVSGALKSSGQVTNTDSGEVIRRTISYGTSLTNPSGDPTSEYAVDRHEMYNPYKPEAYKWLERAVRSTGDDLFLEEVARLLRQAIGSR